MNKRLNSLMFNTNLNTFNVGVSGSNPEQVTQKRFIDSFYKPFLCIIGDNFIVAWKLSLTL